MPHYYDQKQDSRFKPGKIRFIARNREIELFASGGVFSSKNVDKGSLLLINKANVSPEDKILDLGCGYGAVGITLSLFFPNVKFILTDINERAVKLANMNKHLHYPKTKKNVDSNENIIIAQGDKFKNIKDKDFDVILFNPPHSAGKKVCIEMIELSKEHLKKGGTLQLVARHKKGGKSLSDSMEDIFGNIDVVAKGSGFRIYISRKE